MARPGYEAAAMRGLALGDGNVRCMGPVSLEPEETLTIHTVCNSAQEGLELFVRDS